MNFEKNKGNSDYNSEWKHSKLCNRCGERFEKHPNPGKIDRQCDNPRYLTNQTRGCGCKRTPVYEAAQRQKEENDPDWKVDTHCCFCKRATKLNDLRPKKVNNQNHEQCYHCRKMQYIPEEEELFEWRKTQADKRERSLSYERRFPKKTRLTPENEVNNTYAEGSTYNSQSSKQEGTLTITVIDWANDTEEEILQKSGLKGRLGKVTQT